ncbi:VWA domain-containing protein [Oscillochloris sp. ZM17-4]|uniref:VWA domain-containing protein n=1 Tax=Oscillochloris sp. ZM17-4 TaxID=2866714 RepID=UPI001C73595E|nr:VWA domain-containing protein [Oscillochloris sp. ZM17-4]MBX0326525.1 VWA domain-containing protein [Oscillochloris sp. ZM17-4]
MPSLSFIYPEMLWLLGVVALIWAVALLAPRRLSPWRFWGGLAVRSAIALALVLSVAGAQLVLPVDRLTTVFLLDGSDSLAPSLRAQAESFIQDALDSMPEGDEAAIVVFGGGALVERAPSDIRRLGRISSVPVATRTNIADAIQLGLALFPGDVEKRLVLLSDGAENSGHAIEAARLAAARGIPISVVDLALPSGDAEALVGQIEAPTRVRDGQLASLKATIESTIAQRATVRLVGDAGVIAERQIDLQPGATVVPFEVAVSGSGFQRYRVQVQPERDGRAQNNEASALIQVQGPPRVLVVSPSRADSAALVSALKATNVLAEPLAPEAIPADLAGLSVYDAVILVNTPARSLPVGAMAALPSYVRDLGKGLLMIGGDASFGVGGYGRTPVEEAMPVYMDVRNREERPDLAIVFVIDKSGSMDACHCSSPDRGSAQMNTSGGRKVDIAKDAIAQASALLGPQDHMGVVTFDGQAFQTMAVTQGATVDEVISAVAGVEPRGATNVRAGLLKGEEMLVGVDARIKHMILLTDGWGGGGSQNDIAQRLRGEGITLSVVAAGGGSADYLEQLALDGGGRYYPAQDMADVPQIFIQETITTVGNYIIERPFTPVAVGQSPLLAGIGGTPQLYGFNGSTLKDSARLVMSTDDDQPLLATWQYGLGHSAAWMSDASGRWAKDWLTWADFPRFAGQLLGSVLPVRGGQEISTDVTISGGETTVSVDTGALASADLAMTATLIGGDGSRQDLPLTQVGPSSYQGRVENPSPGTYLVQISGSQGERPLIQETAGLVVPYSSEYRSSQGNPALLGELAALTGGATISAAADAFAHVDMRVTSAREIGLPLALLALLLLPLDIALRRLMLRREDFGAAGAWWAARQSARAAPAPTPASATLDRLADAKRRASAQLDGTPRQQPSTNAPPPPPAAPPEDPLERLKAARDRARRRASGEE